MNVLLLHGWGGSDFPHWQSWLAGELAKEYGQVNFLKLPDFDFPRLDVWLKTLQDALESCHYDIVVCHSLGNILWFHLCNLGLIKREVEHLFLVAPPRLDCKIEELKTFFPLQLPKKLFGKDVRLIVSDNDPYMSLQEANMLHKGIEGKMKVLHNAGHINADSGFGEWDYILKEIQRCKR